MALDKITVKGYKSFESLELELRSLNVLIGPNGAGKSNFISLFRLLNEMVEGRFQSAIRRGGGSNAFLYYGQKITKQITVDLLFHESGYNGYYCILEPDLTNSLFFAHERVFFFAPGYPNPETYTIGRGESESQILNVKDKKAKNVANYVLKNMKNWRVYHFHDTSDSAGVKNIGDINDNVYLRSDASNLAAFLFQMSRKYPMHYDRIVKIIRQVAPFFDKFLLRSVSENTTKIQLEWREKNSDYPFLAHYLSDGTLRFICLAVALLQPEPPTTILIDEPELGLHPYALSVLAGLMKSASLKTQIIISTQSIPLIDYFEADDLLIVERQDGGTKIRRVDSDKLSEWIKEYALSELWEKNVLGGRP